MQEINRTTEALNNLREKLREMFQFSNSDLDFGIFRILKIKRDEINLFINEKLTSIVEKALSEVTEQLYDSQLREVKEYIEKEGGTEEREYLHNISDHQLPLIDFLTYKKQPHLIVHLETDPEQLKSQLAFRVYNHIHNFFESYYRDGTLGITTEALHSIRSTTLMRLTIKGQIYSFIGRVVTVTM